MPVVKPKHASNGEVKKALSKLKIPPQPSTLWEGPNGEGLNGGVTQGLLSRYLCCKERTRIHVMEGLREPEGFNHRLEYGNMWHIMEENHAAGRDMDYCVHSVLEYAKGLGQRFKESQQQIQHWYRICIAQFPVYVDFWSRHKDTKKREPICQEAEFSVPYTLPQGRVVRLRGKWDSIDRVEKRLCLQENKAKGEVEVEQLKRQLQFDLQTMFYLTAMTQDGLPKRYGTKELEVRYNVVRRPCSGGKYSIKQKKGQTEEEYYKELQDLIASDPEFFFVRFNVEILPEEVSRFIHVCLNPILENLYDDYEWWMFCSQQGGTKRAGLSLIYDYQFRATRFPEHRQRHFILPFGIWNPLAEGRGTALDEYLSTGSERGLERTTVLYPELSTRKVL